MLDVPQPELLASANVGANMTKIVVSTPTGPVVKVVVPRS